MTAITGVHPYADKFPMLPDAELQELAESIRQNGLRNPIIITPDGLILDGRNRYKACEMADVAPTVVAYDGDDLAEYVLDCNVTRRNMSTGARAMSTALVLEADGRRENGRWKRGSVPDNTESRNTWQDAVRQCGVILDFKPDLAWQVAAGKVTLNDAYQQAEAIRTSAERDKILERERRKREQEEARADAERHAQIVADLTQAESKYLPMIENGSMGPDAAWAAHRADHKKELDRQAAERRNDEEQARVICRTLSGLEFLSYDTQREWCINAVAKYPDAIPSHHLEHHTPERIRKYAELLNTYADELESNHA